MATPSLSSVSAASSTTLIGSGSQPTSDVSFKFPATYNFPPFFSVQPSTSTRLSQLRKWTALIQSYCRHYSIYRLSVVHAVEWPLFHNASLRKRVDLADARGIIDWMASAEGGRRAEWIDGESGGKAIAFIWWKRPEEWAEVLADWVSYLLYQRIFRRAAFMVQNSSCSQCRLNSI